MKLVFMGTPEFAVVSLKKILESRHEVLAVVTVPDKQKGRGRQTKPSAVKSFAESKNLEVLQPIKLNDPNFIQRLKQFKTDSFVVVAFRILPESVFTIPEKGTVNLHASLLPKYRGAAPINRAIINGEEETGVTTMLIDKKVDTGAILLQEKTVITPEMNAGALHDKLAEIGGNLLVKTLDRLEQGTIEPVFQDNTLATKAPKITKEFCHIDFNHPADDVNNFIRGLSPYPGAYCKHKGNILKIFKSHARRDCQIDAKAGTVVDKNKNQFTVRCKNGCVAVSEVQLEGKKRMPVRDFFNGYTINTGDIFT